MKTQTIKYDILLINKGTNDENFCPIGATLGIYHQRLKQYPLISLNLVFSGQSL
jgi:hypothetical protein